MSNNNMNSEEVAEDYKSSLEDLVFNSRWEISNLTVIAKENIHAAQAISKVIEEHIEKAAPARKLPALYLLDSIVKNVGTPYTLFLGRNLYKTFMNAYTLVDQTIRKKLEEMLHTWKQPSPNSPAPTPVFPAEITRKIEAALIKARTVAVQLQQKQMKQQQERMNFGQGPKTTQAPAGYPAAQLQTASTILPHHAAKPAAQAPYDYGRTGADAYKRTTPTPQPTGPSIYNQPVIPLPVQQQLLPAGLPPMAGNSTSIESLHSDIASLIVTAKNRFAEFPWDEEAQKRLKALLDLQNILKTRTLPHSQLAMVKDQLEKLATLSPTPPTPLPPAPVPQPAPAQVSMPFQAASLAALLSGPLTQFNPQNPLTLSSVPVTLPHIPQVSIPLPAVQPQVPAPPVNDTSSLLASLRSAGLLPGLNGGGISLPPLPPPPPAAQPIAGTPFLGGIVPATLPIIQTPPPRQTTTNNWRPIDVELKTASLKIPRPHLISLLYEALPNQCSSCARRFTSDEAGKTAKASHLDWHFRVHQRMAESQKRGQNRSWYVGEEDWIKSTDELDTVAPNASVAVLRGVGPNASGSADQAEQGKKAAREQYVPVPNDTLAASAPCPVCKERFDTSWHMDAEEWVWMNAIKVGQKVYHASCFSESGAGKAAGKDANAGAAINAIATAGMNGNSPKRGRTPEINIGDLAAILKSVKRKAEDAFDSAAQYQQLQQQRVKIKREV